MVPERRLERSPEPRRGISLVLVSKSVRVRKGLTGEGQFEINVKSSPPSARG